MILLKLNDSPAARQLENFLAQSAVQTDIPTAKSVNVYLGQIVAGSRVLPGSPDLR